MTSTYPPPLLQTTYGVSLLFFAMLLILNEGKCLLGMVLILSGHDVRSGEWEYD